MEIRKWIVELLISTRMDDATPEILPNQRQGESERESEKENRKRF
jgi:hypothetical protein